MGCIREVALLSVETRVMRMSNSTPFQNGLISAVVQMVAC